MSGDDLLDDVPVNLEELDRRELDRLRRQILEQDEVICMLVRELRRLSRMIHWMRQEGKGS